MEEASTCTNVEENGRTDGPPMRGTVTSGPGVYRADIFELRRNLGAVFDC
jgi:hypothetical protein